MSRGVSVPLIMPENCTVAWTDSERGAPVVFGETVNGTARLVPGGTLPIEMPGDAVLDVIEKIPHIAGLTPNAILTNAAMVPLLPPAAMEIVLWPFGSTSSIWQKSGGVP